MKELIDKLSSYNIFNYLFPGTLFVILLSKLTVFSLVQEDIVIAAFLYYFIGLVISRFGSLIVEPALKKISFLEFADYKEFISASRKDPKIEILSESNNMYRTLVSMFILLLVLKIYELLELRFKIFNTWSPYLLTGLLLVMFLYSYRKQTEYIVKRIKANK